MWNALNMDKWLARLVEVCPHVSGTWCGNALCETPQTVSRLLVGYVPGDHGSWPFMQCDDNGCAWDAAEGTNRGSMDGPNSVPWLDLQPSAEQVYNYRRWLVLKSLQNVWGHYRNMFGILDTAVITQETKLAFIVNTLLQQEQVTPAPGLFDRMLDLALALSSFTPAGPYVQGCMTKKNCSL